MKLKLFIFLLLLLASSGTYIALSGGKPEPAEPARREAKKETFDNTYQYLLVTGLRAAPRDILAAEYKAAAKGSGTAVYADSKDKETLYKLLGENKVHYLDDQGLVNKKVNKEKAYALVEVNNKDLNTRAVLINGKNPLVKEELNPLTITLKEEFKRQAKDTNVTRLKAVGDIVLGRTVIRNMQKNGWCSPFKHVKSWLEDADITFGNLENAVSDKYYSPPAPHTMRFVAPSKALCGLKASGIDLVSLANNHSLNAGPGGLLDTITALKKNGIESVGAGKNARAAHDYKIIEKNGTKFAFLGYNTITGGYGAGKNSPGLAHINIRPWYPYNKKHVAAMAKDIGAAKENSDFVVVIYHWGQEYVRKPNAEQRKVAKIAVDAGADLIVGIHSHWVQGFEIYKGKLILYSLGNFVFDQSWSRDTEEGVAWTGVLLGDKLIDFSMKPFAINQSNQPKFNLGTARGDKITKDFYTTPN